MNLRRTKIVATLGPATSSPEALERIIAAGADVVRLNFSHGSAEDHRKRQKLYSKPPDLLAVMSPYWLIYKDLKYASLASATIKCN